MPLKNEEIALIEKSKYVKTSMCGKLDSIAISHSLFTAEICLFGAHLLSFKPQKDEIERIWLSASTIKDGSKPIRGGVPVCWPWFAANTPRSVDEFCTEHKLKAPSHGSARTQHWHLKEITESVSGLEIRMVPSELGKHGYCKDFSAEMVFVLSECCELQLITHNQSTSEVNFGCALHSYFAVESIKNVSLNGIVSSYKDKTKDFAEFASLSPYKIDGEVDRIHEKDDLNKVETIDIIKQDERLDLIKIQNQGNNALVVWNPWECNSKALIDMETQGYKTMLCIESAIVEPIELGPMQTHCLSQVIY